MRDRDRSEVTFVVSALAATELRRLSVRMALPDHVASTLDAFRIVRLTQPVLDLAGVLPHPHLGTLDAIHVASALLAEVPEFVTYDHRQAHAARAEGLLVHSPGQDA